MKDDRRRKRLHVDWRRGLIPLSLLVLIILRFGLGAPLWLLVVFSMWVPLYFAAYPMYRQHAWKRFEREFNLRFQRRDYKGLLEYYKGQWFLRRFGPRHEMLGKLGLIYSAMERYREAEHAFERAIDADRQQAPELLYYNLANIKYELGKYDEAIQLYRSLRTNSPYQHSIRTQLALIDLHKGSQVDEARAFLARERSRTTGAMRARIEAALAQHPS